MFDCSMTRESDSLFGALFALEEVREVLRETAPNHALSAEQKERVTEALEKVKKAVAALEEWSR